VLGVEEHRGAVEAARLSQRLNGIGDRSCRFVTARVEDALDRIGPSRSPGDRAVVLDPPRSGCRPRTLHRLVAEIRPVVMVYVSCDPDALARDLAVLLDPKGPHGAGYRVTRVQPVDMFPHTTHIEAVAVLHRGGAVDGGPPAANGAGPRQSLVRKRTS
jgi:23S rRNA (uracil1939-C5)-methyltransferase